ncbi:MAG: hypothetical protein WB676_25580 [Bryobacteraceae bacterium]
MFKMFSTMTLFGLLTVPAIHAQSSQPIQAYVPFSFTVRDTTMRPGNYRLTYNSISHILSIRGTDRQPGQAFVLASPGGVTAGPANLVFHCYDKSCRLAQLWQGSNAGGSGVKLWQNEPERRLAFLTRVVPITNPAK